MTAYTSSSMSQITVATTMPAKNTLNDGTYANAFAQENQRVRD